MALAATSKWRTTVEAFPGCNHIIVTALTIVATRVEAIQDSLPLARMLEPLVGIRYIAHLMLASNASLRLANTSPKDKIREIVACLP
jgi:hypothetical protein